MGRLVRVDYSNGTLIKYNYDPAGNRVSVQQGGMPVAIDDTGVNVAEDTAQDIDVLANDEDLNEDPLSIANVQNGTNGVTAIVQINGIDWVRYTPNANFNGQDSFTYTATDGTAQSTATVTVDVIADNDAPIAVDDAISPDEDTPHEFDPRVNDSDVETPNTALTITAKTDGANGAVDIISSGTQLRYTPNANFNGQDSFVYTISDGVLMDTATVNVTVNAINDPPVAQDDAITTNEDTQKVFDPRGNDTDIETATGSLLINAKTNGSKGAVAIINGGTQLRYTPNANANGFDSFTYTIQDGGGASDIATVNVTINAVNDPVIAVNDSLTTNEDVQKIFDPRTNDINVDGGAFTITAKTNGARGNVAIVSGGTQLRYSPHANISGSDSFTYTVSNGSSSDTATVNVTIHPINDRPNAVDDTYYNVNNSAWTTLNVRSNDTDADGDMLTITGVSISIGQAQIISGGAYIRYRCNCGLSDNVFSYTVSDGSATDSATVVVFHGGGGGGGGGGGEPLPLF